MLLRLLLRRQPPPPWTQFIESGHEVCWVYKYELHVALE
jgi:hypothetical protein